MTNSANLKYLAEPNLTFGFGQKTIDPRDGLMLYGPFDQKKVNGPKTIGIVGPLDLRKKMISYLHRLHAPFLNDNSSRPSFPGLQAAFGVSINFENIVELDIPQSELERYKRYSDNHQRIFNWTSLYFNSLQTYTKEEEISVDVWIIVIPEFVYLYGRPQSKIPASSDNIKEGLSSKKRKEPNYASLFPELQEEEDRLREAYKYEVNFHNQLKAKLLSIKIVSQIIRQSKIDPILTQNCSLQEQYLETAKAWNISTTLYYKLGGLPWKLGSVRPQVCYLGLVYKKVDESKNANNACCAAQMFLDSGDGMVFRGNVGPWWNPETKQFHLKKADAKALISRSLDAFYKRFNRYPEQIFIHSRTYFDDDEWAGFEEATIGKSKIIGVRITEKTSLKLYRNGNYCIPRGMMLSLSPSKAYLWTKGFIPRIKTQMGLEVPSPLEIIITRGIEDVEVVCRDILSLTKLNYNACIYGDGVPVTLKFADSIGEILTAGKDLNVGILTFKHYI